MQLNVERIDNRIHCFDARLVKLGHPLRLNGVENRP